MNVFEELRPMPYETPSMYELLSRWSGEINFRAAVRPGVISAVRQSSRALINAAFAFVARAFGPRAAIRARCETAVLQRFLPLFLRIQYSSRLQERPVNPFTRSAAIF